MRWFILLLMAVATGAATESGSLLLGSSDRAVIIRWAVDLKKYPDGGFNIFRRSSENTDWQRLNSTSVAPLKNKEKARALFGDSFGKVENLLFAPSAKGLNLRDAIQQEENRNSLALLMADIDARVAQALGLRFDDASAEEGKRYFYRLTRVDRGVETDVAVGEAERGDTEIEAPSGLKGIARDSLVALVWTSEQRFSGYSVFRSETKSGTYRKVNTSPVLVLETEYEGEVAVADVFYRDQSVVAGRTYWYRITGTNAFAQESERSDLISVEVKRKIILPVPHRPNITVRRDSAFLSWSSIKVPESGGYHVYRASDRPDSMKKVTDTPVRGVSFVDRGLSERTAYFYAISAVDEEGHESERSLFVLADVLDFGAPRPPVGITVETDTGLIMLRWQPNAEKDMLGYHVFKATKDTLRAHFFQTTKVPLRQPVFVDQVPRGADYTFYYRLVAVDSSYQFSEFSPIVRGKLPDIVLPIAPVWKDVRVLKDRIEISWAGNPEQDIAGYKLYRRLRGESQWSSPGRGTLPATMLSFRDTSAVPGGQYEYMLEAVDDAMNVSNQSLVVTARRYDAVVPVPPNSVTSAYDSVRNVIAIRWATSPDRSLRGVVVFRSNGGDGKFIQKSRLLQATAFMDDDVRKGETYRYRLRAYDASGNYSEFSQPVIVTTGGARW